MSALFCIESVGLRWPSGQLLFDSLSFGVTEGRAFVLRGGNGSGKSTLLKICNGLLRPDSGLVCYDGRSVGERNTLRRMRRETVLVHDTPFMLPGTLAGNLCLARRFRGLARNGREPEARVAAALQLDHLLQCRAADFSAGELKRAGLARALVLECRALLVDEPLANLDPHSAELVLAALDQYVYNGGTLVATTHDVRLKTICRCDMYSLDDLKTGRERGPGLSGM